MGRRYRLHLFGKVMLVVATLGVLGLAVLPFLDGWLPFSSRHNGWTLEKTGSESLRLSWGIGEDGVIIGAESNLRSLSYTFRGQVLANEGLYPRLSRINGLWMFDADQVLDPGSPVFAASLVNPKLPYGRERIFAIMDSAAANPPDWNAITRTASENFVYLGWVVRDDEDARALRDALAERSKVDLDADLPTAHGLLRRLRAGVEREFASHPTDEAALAAARSEIPVMFEAMNAGAGHPMDAMHVLYLDGHVGCIPFGERFPATRGFVDAFPLPGTLFP